MLTGRGGFLRIAGFSPPVGCYYRPIPVMTGATPGGPSRRFGPRVYLRVDLIGSRPILMPRSQFWNPGVNIVQGFRVTMHLPYRNS